MEIDLLELLQDNLIIRLFLVIAIGYLIGKVNIGGFELGASGGVLFAALGFGHLGFEIPKFIETIGFVFFIYSVGFQAGPRFVSAFKKDGVRYAVLALVIAAMGVGLVLAAHYLLNLDSGYAAGILGGAMTSTPTLAAAQDMVSSGTLSFGELSLDAVNANITVGYAITYVFGLLGLIILMRLIPRFMGIDLADEAETVKKEMNISEDDGDPAEAAAMNAPTVKVYRIENEKALGKPLAALDLLSRTNCLVLEIRRNGDHLTPGPEATLQKNDVIAVAGAAEEQLQIVELFGTPLSDRAPQESFPIVTRGAVVAAKSAVGRTLRSLAIIKRHGCFVSRFEREGVFLDVNPDLVLEKGDTLFVTGLKRRVGAVIDELGVEERPIHETDLLTFALGITAGTVLGLITVKVGNLPIGIGMSGGLLVSGLLIGHLRSRHPTFGRVPAAARFILMELGILLFMAGVGMRAGHDLVAGIKAAGPQIFLTGLVVTILPVVAGVTVGRYLMKMNPAVLLGAVTGAMTSTPALAIVNNSSKSTIPALGYAGTYAVANIVLTLVGQLIVRIA